MDDKLQFVDFLDLLAPNRQTEVCRPI